MEHARWSLSGQSRKGYHLQAFDTTVVYDLDRRTPVCTQLERKGDRSVIRGDQLRVNLGTEAAGKALPAVTRASHGEEDLAGKQAAAVVVGIQ